MVPSPFREPHSAGEERRRLPAGRHADSLREGRCRDSKAAPVATRAGQRHAAHATPQAYLTAPSPPLTHTKHRRANTQTQPQTYMHGTVQYHTVQCNAIQIQAQYSIEYSIVCYNTARHSTLQHGTARYSTAQHATAPQNTADNTGDCFSTDVLLHRHAHLFGALEPARAHRAAIKSWVVEGW